PHFQDDGAPEVAVGKGIDHHTVQNAEHHRRRTDAQRKSKDRDQRETPVLRQAPEGILNVAKKILEVALEARLAAVLLYLFQSATGQIGAAPGFFRRQAGSNEGPDALLQVETQLRVQLSICLSLMIQTTEPTHEWILLRGAQDQGYRFGKSL